MGESIKRIEASSGSRLRVASNFDSFVDSFTLSLTAAAASCVVDVDSEEETGTTSTGLRCVSSYDDPCASSYGVCIIE